MIDLVAQLIVAFAQRIVFDEVEVPLVYLVQVCKTASGEGSQQVECRSRLVVGSDHIFRLGYPCLFGKLDRVDDIATVTRQLFAILLFKVRRPWLGKLSGDASHFDDRLACRVHQHHIHLKHQLEEVFDILRIEVSKTLRTVTALKQKSLTTPRCSKLLLEPAGFTCKDQRRILAKLLLYRFKCGFVRIGRLLFDRECSPASWCPAHGISLHINKLQGL